MPEYSGEKPKRGQRLTLAYEDREFEVIVIDSNGLGKNQPSVGFGFRMMEQYGGLSVPTMSDWLIEGDRNNEQKCLKPPSGNTFRVIEILGLGRNQPSVGFGFRMMERYAGLLQQTLSS